MDERQKKIVLNTLYEAALLFPEAVSDATRAVFMAICLKPGIRLVDIQQQSKLSASTVTRCCRVLERLDLVVLTGSPLSRREKNVHLSSQGEQILLRIIEISQSAITQISLLR